MDPDTGAFTPNGRTVTLGEFTWTATSDPYVFGNDGPFGPGQPRYVDRNLTYISNEHQRFTTAHVTGTIDGVSVEELGEAYLPWPGGRLRRDLQQPIQHHPTGPRPQLTN